MAVTHVVVGGGAAYRQDGLKRKWEGLMTETTQEFVQLFYRDGSIIQPLQDKWSISPVLSPPLPHAPSAKLKWEEKGGAVGGSGSGGTMIRG